MRTHYFWLAVLAAAPTRAAERAFEFGNSALDQTPPAFHSTVAGSGKPGEWKVILEDAPPALEPLTSKAPSVARRAVLAQSARDATTGHFPMLIFDGEAYGDFKFTTRFKITGGGLEQAAGVVFRFQNESNFYAVGASALANHFRCFKVVNGEWKPPIGPEMEISKGTWHELSVECEGTRILCSLDGKDAIKLIDSSANPAGKIGFWTQSDSIACFSDAKVSGKSHETPARKLVADAFNAYPRLLGLKIFAPSANGKGPIVIASKDEQELGQPGGKTELDVITNGTVYYGKGKGSVYVIQPLRDRNGEPIAAACVIMRAFPGQTEENALSRALPVVQNMQGHVQSLDDLVR